THADEFDLHGGNGFVINNFANHELRGRKWRHQEYATPFCREDGMGDLLAGLHPWQWEVQVRAIRRDRSRSQANEACGDPRDRPQCEAAPAHRSSRATRTLARRLRTANLSAINAALFFVEPLLIAFA